MYTNTIDTSETYIFGAEDEDASSVDTENCWPKIIELYDKIPFLNSAAHNMMVKNLVQYVATVMQ